MGMQGARAPMRIQPRDSRWTSALPTRRIRQQTQLDSIVVSAREDIAEEVIPSRSDHAIEVGHYGYSATNKIDKKPRGSSGRYMVLRRKDADGVWRLQRDIGAEAPTVTKKS